MSNPNPLQIPQLLNWKQIYDQAETLWSKPLNQMIGSEAYLTLTSLMREQAMTRHETSKEVFEAYWEALRLPTKTDHVRLAGQVVALEAKVEGLSDKLDAVTAQLDAILAAVQASNARAGHSGNGKKSPVEA